MIYNTTFILYWQSPLSRALLELKMISPTYIVPNYFVKRGESVKQLTSVAYIIAGVAALYFGVVLSRSAYNM